jgi:hypothetical protein
MHTGFAGVYQGFVKKRWIGGVFPQIYRTFTEAFDYGYFWGLNNPENVIGDMMCGKYGTRRPTRAVLPAR